MSPSQVAAQAHPTSCHATLDGCAQLAVSQGTPPYVYEVTIKGPLCPNCAGPDSSRAVCYSNSHEGTANTVGLSHRQRSRSLKLPAWGRVGSEYLGIGIFISFYISFYNSVWSLGKGSRWIPCSLQHTKDTPGKDVSPAPVVPKVGHPLQSPGELSKVHRPGSHLWEIWSAGLASPRAWRYLKAACRINYIICGSDRGAKWNRGTPCSEIMKDFKAMTAGH